MKKYLAFLLALLLVLSMAVSAGAAYETRTVTVTDMSGDEVTIEGGIKSIVNLWPAGTSSFFVMGAGDLISAMAVNNVGIINSWCKVFTKHAGGTL